MLLHHHTIVNHQSVLHFPKLTRRKLQFKTQRKTKWTTQPYILLLTFDNGTMGRCILSNLQLNLWKMKQFQTRFTWSFEGFFVSHRCKSAYWNRVFFFCCRAAYIKLSVRCIHRINCSVWIYFQTQRYKVLEKIFSFSKIST